MAKMKYLGMRNGKELWRGTGFNTTPGGLTLIEEWSPSAQGFFVDFAKYLRGLYG